MDERSHHQSSMPTAQDGRGLEQQPGSAMPWPGAAPAPHYAQQPLQPAVQAWQSQGGAPAHQQFAQPQGHPSQQLQPTPQYAYAPGFVLPGAAGGQAPPMSAHGGTIGTPHAPAPGAPAHHGHPPAAPGAWQQGAVATAAQPQAWAYQTPQGLQLVQPGAAAYAAQPSPHGVGARRRIRWETIVPAAAVTCLVAAIGIFFAQFDEMTGRGSDVAGTPTAAAAATEPSADTGSAAAPGAGDAAEVVAQARTFFEQGRFDDAANLLHPLLDAEAPDPAAVTLHDQVDAAATRNRALLGRLTRERSAGRWQAVVGTIGELEQLRPLSKDLVQMRGTARRAVRTQAIVAKAKSLMAARRDGEALAVVERGLATGANRQLEALREQLSARMAAPAARPSTPAAQAGTPPRAGGAAARPNTTPAQPPANVPQGAIPARPDLPNPTGGAAAVAPAVAGGGGGGTNCHEHDGVRECH